MVGAEFEVTDVRRARAPGVPGRKHGGEGSGLLLKEFRPTIFSGVEREMDVDPLAETHSDH